MNKGKSTVYLALPDGHIMNHLVPFLEKTGLGFDGYVIDQAVHRPVFRPISEKAKTLFGHPENLSVKVIRPQDMPIHVANGNFDLALSGTDWLAEHKIRFLNSPVDEIPLLKLGLSKVRIVSAAHKDYGRNLEECINTFRTNHGTASFRIASEYVYIADKYAQQKNLYPYRIIMTFGATESLIPEDCDMIIENTETGNTLRKNNLEILETIMESEACLIVNRESMEIPEKRELILCLKALFEEGLKTIIP